MLGKVTVGLLFLLLVWGNLVAGMKSGLGCPDWPLCHGRVVPPFRVDIYMEFMHRVIAAGATTALLLLSYRRFRAYDGPAKAVPVVAVGLIAAEIVMGGLVVLLGLPPQLTTVHFMTGLLVFLLTFYMAAFDGVQSRPAFSVAGPAAVYLGMCALVFFQAALGAYVRHSGAGLACPDFPTCLGTLVPPVVSGLVLAHFSHRLMAYLILFTALALYAATLIDARFRAGHRYSLVLLALATAQAGVGAVVVLSGLYYMATALHLAVALCIMGVLALMWVGEVRGAGA
jgi:heme A synthase